LVVASALCGCTGMSRALDKLKKDNATVVLKVDSLYGKVNIIRLMPGTNTEITVSPDGVITVKRP
jgi:hypothetical protein